MKMKLIFAAVLSVLLFGCSDDDDNRTPSEPISYSNTTETPIVQPPNGCSETANPPDNTSNITVAEEGVITDVSKFSVTLEIHHTWSGDLTVELVAPGGESIPLIKRVGLPENGEYGNGTQFSATKFLTFSTTATQTLLTNWGPEINIFPTGTYLPTGSDAAYPQGMHMEDLSEFLSGKNINGNWQIRIRDYCNEYNGSLESWKLDFAEGALN